MLTRREFTMSLIATGASAGVASLTACTGILPAVEATTTASLMAVDCHAHVFLRSLSMPDRRRAPSGYDASPDDYWKTLHANGMTHGVLVQPSFLGTDNSYMVEALRQYPDRLRGIAVVDPSISVAQLDLLQAAGVVGIRLNQVGLPTPDFASPAWRGLLKQLRLRNWQVEVHQLAHGLQPIIDPLVDAGIDVVVDHFGRPDPQLGVDDPGFNYLLKQGASGKVWIKLSGAYRNGANGRGQQVALQAMPLLRETYGLKQLVWGSDWPHTLFERTAFYADQRQLLNQWLPEARDRQQVLVDVPARLFGFPV
ncbi:amidohydrolase family protein [Undibacterium sp. RuRC25W]|uniref:amidohydrolase family protein n=1 Tax=Undibacterium sp. RuRC25W TaxID=3413047 RepID=UPI003BF2FFB1